MARLVYEEGWPMEGRRAGRRNWRETAEGGSAAHP